MFDLSEIRKVRDRVQRALAAAGSSPWLFGYDVIGIQGFITARNRPIAMRGASETIRDLDRGSDMNIFCGGGRGIGLLPNEEAAAERSCELAARYRAKGGVLVTAAVPYHADRPAQSLSWLRAKLEIAKDAAPTPPGTLPEDKQTQCASCWTYLATYRTQRKETEERICRLCSDMIERGGQTNQMSISLGDLSPSCTIAAVSADGNGLGTFFDGLGTLEQNAAASEAIARIFQGAHDAAAAKLTHQFVPLVTGGDDIRVFLAAEELLTYIETLVRQVESLAVQAGNLGGLLPADSAAKLAALGVGVGAVVADDHYPASRLMDYAHQLEDSAKTICRPGTTNKDGASSARSAFDFAVLTSTDAFAEGPPRRSPADGRPFTMEETSWGSLLRSAKALARVPSAQRGILAAARILSAPEYLNLFRYQVARSRDWQDFYKACDLEWQHAATLDKHRPKPGLLDLLRLLG